MSPALTAGLNHRTTWEVPLCFTDTTSVNSHRSSPLQIETEAQEIEGAAQVHAAMTRSVCFQVYSLSTLISKQHPCHIHYSESSLSLTAS